MSEGSDRFLTAFNRIEKWLREQIEKPNGIGFSELVRRLSKKSALQVRVFEDDLLEMAQLRNAIIHDKIAPDFIIAEPNEWAIKRIELIEKELTTPEKVLPRFQKKVTGFEKNTSLSDILRIVAVKGYSQFPIYDRGNFCGLITANGLGFWLAQESQKSTFEIKQKSAADILRLDRKSDNYRFIHAETPVFEVVELFKKSGRLEAVLITKDGNPNGSLEGIIRPRDIFTIEQN